jgi:hypothetical protein
VDLHALNGFVSLHTEHVSTSNQKIYQVASDTTPEQIEIAFHNGRKEQLLGLLEYGIDIFAPLCIGDPSGKEHWLIDFYGRNSKHIARDLLLEEKEVIVKAYKKARWKISLVGGSVQHWNRRRHFVAFLEKYVINLKNQELREKAKDLFSIVIVQSAIMSYL